MKKYFFTGLVTLLPVAVTFWIVHFLVRLLTQPFVGIVSAIFHQFPIVSEQFIRILSQITILVFLFVFTVFLGFVARRFFFGQMIQLGDKILHKIPLVNKVYKTSKEIVQSLFGTDKNSFQQTVLLPFPYEGSYCIGLITREAPKKCEEQANQELISVFIPTTPNPTTGFLVMCKKSDLIFLNMKSEEAIKYVVSCAVIQPAGRP